MNGTKMTEKAMIERKWLVPGFPNIQGSRGLESSSSVAAFVIGFSVHGLRSFRSSSTQKTHTVNLAL